MAFSSGGTVQLNSKYRMVLLQIFPKTTHNGNENICITLLLV